MKIYVGNIPKDLEESELSEMFEEYGKVKKTQIIRDRFTKISRGFAFVEMDDRGAAMQAIEDWNEGSIDDHIIYVKESKPKTKRKK